MYIYLVLFINLFFYDFSESLGNPIRKCTIVSDSIAKYVSDIIGTSVTAFPGINISRLSNRISKGFVDLNSEFVILHVGTNDINSLHVLEMLSSYNDLLSVVRSCSRSQIAVSACLPRPIDHEVNGNKIKEFNKGLEKLCRSRNVKFLRTFRPFLFNGCPRRELFAVRDGGLHLNLEGTRRLRQFFINSISHF